MVTFRNDLARPIAAVLLAVAAIAGATAVGHAATRPVAATRAASAVAVDEPTAVRKKPASRAAVAPAPAKKVTAAKTRAKPKGKTWIFEGLGAWIDLYDLPALNRARTIARMRRAGVRTLYIQTGRTNTKRAVSPRVGPWLRAAHRAGIKVVGWYLPYYTPLDKDLERTLAIRRFRWRGHRFDGLGVDIEFKGAVTRNRVWNRRVVSLMRSVRRRVGSKYPVAAVPPPPLQMRLAPGMWKGFPWRGMAEHADAVMLMSYWSDRSGCPRIRRHCAYDYTKRNVRLTRRLVGKGPAIHIIGGIGDSITPGQLGRFVAGARDGGADGASIYDVATTKAAYWPILSRLRRLS